MPQPGPLPPDFHGTTFLVSDAKARGVSIGRLRSLDLQKPHRGVRSHRVQAQTVFDRCSQYAVLMSGSSAFSHSTAALLFSMPMPPGPADAPLHVTVDANAQPPRGHGIIGHRGRADHLPLWRFDTFLLCAPVDVWCQLALILNWEDLVAVGDYLISGRRTDFGREPPLATVAELTAAVDLRAAARGVRRMRMALPLLRIGVDSRPETLLRLLLVASGLPEPLIGDPTLVDQGTFTLHPDLKYVQWRVVLEYEGDGHRSDPRRFREDITRRERFEAAGWHVVRVTLDDLFVNPAAFIARVRAVLRDREHYLASRVQ